MKTIAGRALTGLGVMLLTAALCLPSAASADEAKGSLTLWCVEDEETVSGMQWQICRVGRRAADDYVFEGDYAECRATLGDESLSMLDWDAETVADAAETLKVFTIAKKIPAVASGKTNEEGSLTFSDLDDGLYLVWGNELTVGDTTYIPSAIFFEMNGAQNADLDAFPKIVWRTLDESSVNYSVRKVWMNDETQPWNRSVSITVERYRDNELFDEVVLNEENDWTFTWEDTIEHIWLVHEKIIPDHYTVAYKERHTQYFIVNTFESDDDTETTTAATTTTTDTTTTAATTTTGTQIAQTGQLWWPVPVLASGGVLLFGFGIALRKREDEE